MLIPLTNVKNINKLNEIEAELGVAGSKTSWHEQYKDSAYIFIGGLPFDLTEGDIICVFSQYGEIVNINLVRDKKSGKSKGYCFLAYENQRSTILAVDNLNSIKLLGRVLRVDHVSGYRKPKEDETDDDITKKLRQEGCAPRTPSPPPSDEEDNLIPKKKAKKEHKSKSKPKDKKKKRKKRKKDHKDSSKFHTDTSDLESSHSERHQSPPSSVEVKQEVDGGYLDPKVCDVRMRGGEQDEPSRHMKYHYNDLPEKDEKRLHKYDGRTDRRGDRVTKGERESQRGRDRDRFGDSSCDRQGTSREEKGDKVTETKQDREFHKYSRDERHSDRWADRGDERYWERRVDGEREISQDTSGKLKIESRSPCQEPVRIRERELYTDRQRHVDRGRCRETNVTKKWRGEGERDWDRYKETYRVRESNRSGQTVERTMSRERHYYD